MAADGQRYQKKIRAIPKQLARLPEAVAGYVLLLMVIHIVADVTSKMLFNYPLAGTLNIVASYYMIGVVFLPIALVEFTRQNISVDLFYNLFSRKLRWLLLLLATLLSIVFYAMLGYQSVPDAIDAMEKKEFIDGTIYLVTWPGRFILPISFLCVVLVLIYRLTREIRSGENDPDLAELTANQNSDAYHD